MTGPSINPPDSWWQSVWSECPECWSVIDDEFRISSDIIELYCESCDTTWNYTIGA